ncbi:PLP-dependent aminotransferase family protein [Lentzea sp. HUAS TT2]|uniref:MocR-like pyridoxine biosynthesis transcription factor PdxR n=1 Tax=Lentzea sp. HUAS TT2 TaxID=3447454 RepID=UPI003F70A69D
MTDASTTSGPVPGLDLHLERHGAGVREGLLEAFREAIRSGRLAPGTRLPSSRALSSDIGVARNTVVQVYAELTAEGRLVSRQGSGTEVAPRSDALSATPGGWRHPRRPPRLVHDLRPGRPDLSSFPRNEWLRALRRALQTAPDEALGYGDVHGLPVLREAVATYLARARGVHTRPDNVIVSSGTAQGLALLAGALHKLGVRTAAVEEFGLPMHTRLLESAGMEVVPLPLDEHGAQVAALDQRPEVGMVLLTPSHQFPTGVALHPDRRVAVVDWARRTGGLVVEDDYDGEFRYDRTPVGALQGTDPDHVIYLGSTSKSLAPGLRLGWIVVPDHLVDVVAGEKGEVEVFCGFSDQLAMAEFIESGAYDRHIRTMRQRYRRRRDQLVTALAGHATRITGMAAGLHVLAELPDGEESVVSQGSAWQGLATKGLADFRHPDAAPGKDALVIGYATPSPSAWNGALRALAQLLP